jgi:acetyl-CoA carboxylase biotin carboxyl carrier protein
MMEKSIKKLVRLVEESDIDVLEVSTWWRKIRITRRLNGSAPGNGHNAPVLQYTVPPRDTVAAAPAAAPAAPAVATAPAEDESRYVAVKSPMVGTFYAAPAPDAKPYVEPGQRIEKGQVVCIVEAMKLMNEIESEVSGRVAKISVQNAHPVEFGQTMFLIDPTG